MTNQKASLILCLSLFLINSTLTNELRGQKLYQTECKGNCKTCEIDKPSKCLSCTFFYTLFNTKCHYCNIRFCRLCQEDNICSSCKFYHIPGKVITKKSKIGDFTLENGKKKIGFKGEKNDFEGEKNNFEDEKNSFKGNFEKVKENDFRDFQRDFGVVDEGMRSNVCELDYERLFTILKYWLAILMSIVTLLTIYCHKKRTNTTNLIYSNEKEQRNIMRISHSDDEERQKKKLALKKSLIKESIIIQKENGDEVDLEFLMVDAGLTVVANEALGLEQDFQLARESYL